MFKTLLGKKPWSIAGIILLPGILFSVFFIRDFLDLSLAQNLERCNQKQKGASLTDCYEELFANYLRRNSPESVLKQFSRAMEESPAVRRDCHQISHAIGRAALAKLGDITAVFQLSRNLDTCGGGFFHGAIEKLFRPAADTNQEHIDKAEMVKKIPTLCDQFADLEQKRNCIHGIGHGALFLLGNRDQALGVCQLLPDKNDWFSCFSGVFMEYIFSGRAAADNATDPLFPCSGLAEPYRSPCYYVQSFRLTALGLEKASAVKECRQAGGLAGEMCLRGYGIFFLAHQALADGFLPVVRFCESLQGDDTGICAESVASRLTEYSRDGRQALPFCALFDSVGISRRCFSYATAILRLLYKFSPEALQETCRANLANPELCLETL